MYNHFRTLLLNMRKVNDTDLIPASYSPKKLTGSMKEMYDKLFPAGLSLEAKLALADAYVGIVKAAGLDDALTKHDKRIVKAALKNNFKINRHSQPKTTDSKYPLFVTGDYIASSFGNTDRILVKQVPGQEKIIVYSFAHGAYLTITGGKTNDKNDPVSLDTELVDEFGDFLVDEFGDKLMAAVYSGGEVTTAVIDVTRAPGAILSDPIPLGLIGLTLYIGMYDVLTATADKTWEFVVEAPHNLDLDKLIVDLGNSNVVANLFRALPDTESAKYDAMWKTHFNKLYRLAGLLVSFVYRVHKL